MLSRFRRLVHASFCFSFVGRLIASHPTTTLNYPFSIINMLHQEAAASMPSLRTGVAGTTGCALQRIWWFSVCAIWKLAVAAALMAFTFFCVPAHARSGHMVRPSSLYPGYVTFYWRVQGKKPRIREDRQFSVGA